MSSGKKFSECVYCIHYKNPHAGLLCSACECEKENPFADPSQFKTFTSLTEEFLGDPVKKTGIYAEKGGK